jgi:hypothetical protein
MPWKVTVEAQYLDPAFSEHDPLLSRVDRPIHAHRSILDRAPGRGAHVDARALEHVDIVLADRVGD